MKRRKRPLCLAALFLCSSAWRAALAESYEVPFGAAALWAAELPGLKACEIGGDVAQASCNFYGAARVWTYVASNLLGTRLPQVQQPAARLLRHIREFQTKKDHLSFATIINGGRDIISKYKSALKKASATTVDLAIEAGGTGFSFPNKSIARTADNAKVQLAEGVSMPLVGLGTWQMRGQPVRDAVKHALKVGYRHIDTAQAYDNEVDIGEALAKSRVPREDIFLSSKLSGNEDYGRDSTPMRVQVQLDHLQTSYFDLYMLHSPGPNKDKMKEAWRALEKLHEQKVIRALGVSNFDEKNLKSLLKFAKHKPVYCQNKLSVYMPGEQSPSEQRSMLKFLIENNIQPVGYSVISAFPQLLDQLHDPHVVKIAERIGRTPSQVLHRWALQLGAGVLPKSATKDRIKENFQLLDFHLSDMDMQLLSGLSTLGGSGAEKRLPYVNDVYNMDELVSQAMSPPSPAKASSSQVKKESRKARKKRRKGKSKDEGEEEPAGEEEEEEDGKRKGRRRRKRKARRKSSGGGTRHYDL